MTMEAMGADAGCIDDRLLGARNHPGAVQVGEKQEWLIGSRQVRFGQGPTLSPSVRCRL